MRPSAKMIARSPRCADTGARRATTVFQSIAASSTSIAAARTRRSSPLRATSSSVSSAGVNTIAPRQPFARALRSSVAPAWCEIAYCSSRSAWPCGAMRATISASTSESLAVVPSTFSPGTGILWPPISPDAVCARTRRGCAAAIATSAAHHSASQKPGRITRVFMAVRSTLQDWRCAVARIFVQTRMRRRAGTEQGLQVWQEKTAENAKNAETDVLGDLGDLPGFF